VQRSTAQNDGKNFWSHKQERGNCTYTKSPRVGTQLKQREKTSWTI